MTDEYRAKAEYCRQMADQVLSPLDKEMWLQLAWDWSTLASVRERYGTDQYRAPQLAEPLMLGLH
jgi:predicted DNA-binding ArsR family transcriptional regulator